MAIIADFHIHSKFSIATSPLMIPKYISQYAEIKGVDIVGTGDFLHPKYLEILENKLIESADGIYTLKNGRGKTLFVLTTEICNIFRHNGKTKKIHTLMFSPSLKDCKKMSKSLENLGKIGSDGRPIFSMHIKEIMKRIMDINNEVFFVPAHIWTPWYSLFGSFSGFDSPEECFEDMSEYIFALETGLSSDPAMNRKVSKLDRYTLISNSDAHSPMAIGREANVFSSLKNFNSLKNSLKGKKGNDKLLYTIEFYPQEGKYFADGHRKCNFSIVPKKKEKEKKRCPRCGKTLTQGVLNRIHKLSDRSHVEDYPDVVNSKHLVPLDDIISKVVGIGKKSKTVREIYNKLVRELKSEFNILLDAKRNDIKEAADESIAEAIINVRKGKVKITPGYDGVFGKIDILR
ncbi:MAG: DNA helicase UvrD [Candidatus Schekmanbacteria bacterium]|nr:MAG: DNA helicase UvrD [Candidatus Schekmanbacteria bacterium]